MIKVEAGVYFGDRYDVKKCEFVKEFEFFCENKEATIKAIENLEMAFDTGCGPMFRVEGLEFHEWKEAKAND